MNIALGLSSKRGVVLADEQNMLEDVITTVIQVILYQLSEKRCEPLSGNVLHAAVFPDKSPRGTVEPNITFPHGKLIAPVDVYSQQISKRSRGKRRNKKRYAIIRERVLSALKRSIGETLVISRTRSEGIS